MAGWVGTRKAKLGPFSMVLTPLFLGIVIMVASCEVKHTQYQAKTPTTSGSQIENPNSGSITHGILPTGEPFTIEWIAQEAANQYFVKLRWKPLENKVLAIHRAEHGNAPSLIAQTQLGQTEFVDKNVSSNESYRYKIEVFDLSGKRIKVPVDVTLNIPKDYVLGADVISPTQQFSITEMEKGELATISEHFFGRFLRHNREALALENFNRLFLQNSQNRDRGVTIQLNDNLKDFKLDVGEIKALPGSTIIFKNVIPNKKRICLRRLRIHAKQARGELRVVMDNCEDESQSLRFPKLDVDIVTGDSFKFAIDLQGKYEDPTSEIEGMVRIGGKRTFYCSRLPISDDEVVGLYENVRFNKHSSGGRAPYFFLFFDGQIRSLFPGKDGNTIFHSKDLALGTPCRLKGKSLRLLDTEAMRVENAQGKYTELAAYLTALNEAAWRLEKTLAKHLIRVHLEFGESSTAKSSRLISVLDFLSSNPDRLVKFLSLKGLQSIRITDKESEQANLSQEALVIPAGITNSPNQLLEWMDRDLWSY